MVGPRPRRIGPTPQPADRHHSLRGVRRDPGDAGDQRDRCPATWRRPVAAPAPRLTTDQQGQLVGALLTLPVASAEDQASQNATAQCGEMLLAALVTAVPYVKQEDLANDLAARLLTVVQDDARSGQSATIALAGSWLPRKGACLIGLAQLASVTKQTIRDQIVGTLPQATSDTRLSYSQTSGRVSPPKHAGADALALLVPSLTREELATATQAIPARSPQQKPDDYASMYTAVKAALAARREALPQEPT